MLRQDLIGISYNKNFSLLNEAITEKITCEILNIDKNEQFYHCYASMFIAIDELTNLISWQEIIQAYFSNNIVLFKKVLGHDLKKFLYKISILYMTNPLLPNNNSMDKITYQFTYNEIVDLINNHTRS